MPSYHYLIRKGDHPGDLHVHVRFYGGGVLYGRLLGRFRIPSLEPLPGTKNILTQSEINSLREWLSDERQIRKLQDCLSSTVFDSHQLAISAMKHVKEGVIVKEKGETYITIKIPVVDRI